MSGTPAPREVARRYIEELWNGFDAAAEARLIGPDYIDRTLPRGMAQGPAGHHAALEEFRQAFPDARYTVEDIITEGALTAVRWCMQGTHAGIVGGYAPTGRRVTMTGVDILRVTDGRIREIWHFEDMTALEGDGAADDPQQGAAARPEPGR